MYDILRRWCYRPGGGAGILLGVPADHEEGQAAISMTGHGASWAIGGRRLKTPDA
jgi:hypothetical protein